MWRHNIGQLISCKQASAEKYSSRGTKNYHWGGGGGVAKVQKFVVYKRAMTPNGKLYSHVVITINCANFLKWLTVQQPAPCTNSCNSKFTNRRDAHVETQMISSIQHCVHSLIATSLRAWNAWSQDIKDATSLGSFKMKLKIPITF